MDGKTELRQIDLSSMLPRTKARKGNRYQPLPLSADENGHVTCPQPHNVNKGKARTQAHLCSALTPRSALLLPVGRDGRPPLFPLLLVSDSHPSFTVQCLSPFYAQRMRDLESVVPGLVPRAFALPSQGPGFNPQPHGNPRRDVYACDRRSQAGRQAGRQGLGRLLSGYEVLAAFVEDPTSVLSHIPCLTTAGDSNSRGLTPFSGL